MLREAIRSTILCVATFSICAVAYPALVWGAARLISPHGADGSLVYSRDRTVIGSELIGQKFESDKYFHSRPSAVDYAADATGGSNLGTNNPDLRKALAERAVKEGATADRPAPLELTTASGSGVDPDITPEAAEYQIARIAKCRGVTEDALRDLIRDHTDASGLILGSPRRVNVLALNLALDALRASR